MKKESNFCFINNYFDVFLKAWETNIVIQLVFNEYKAVLYMCQFFSKTEDSKLNSQNQAAKIASEKNMYHHNTMKTIAKADLSNRNCSVQETVYHILLELNLRRIFPAVYFVKEFKYYFLEKNKADFHTKVQTFLRNLILIATWKDLVQRSAMENTVY